jgi:hypothetical protein
MMYVQLQSQGSNAGGRVEISTLHDTVLGSAEEGVTWRALLPATQAYNLTVTAPAGDADYDFLLWVVIPP